MGHRHRGGVFFAMRLAVLVVPVQMGAISTGRLGVVGGLELPSERRLGELPEGAPGVLGAEFLDVDVYELVRRTEHLASEFLGDLDPKGASERRPELGQLALRWAVCVVPGVGVGVGADVDGRDPTRQQPAPPGVVMCAGVCVLVLACKAQHAGRSQRDYPNDSY